MQGADDGEAYRITFDGSQGGPACDGVVEPPAPPVQNPPVMTPPVQNPPVTTPPVSPPVTEQPPTPPVVEEPGDPTPV